MRIGTDPYDEIVANQLKIEANDAQRRLRAAIDELSEAASFQDTLKTAEWKPFVDMVTRLIKQADRELVELRGLHDPATQEKAIRLQSHILTLMQIIAKPINRASMVEQLRQTVLDIKSEIIRKFGV